MQLIKEVDSFLESPMPISPPRPYHGFYPSTASCVIKNEYNEDEVVGKCLRAVYWSAKAVEQTNPMNARSFRITSVGKMMESWEISKYKEMGIWRGNSVKFFDADNKVSGEVDAFVWDNKLKDIIGVEIKTGYGYEFEKNVIGKPERKGTPKFDHLIQTMLYLNYFKSVPLFKMVYLSRGNAARVEFDVTLDRHSGAAVVDGKIPVPTLSIPNILNRFRIVGKHLEDSTLPERDYQLQYSNDRLKFLYDSRRLNKKETAEFEKNKKVTKGDWRCSYCEYKDYCWKENKNGK
jgi:hypothetical protein